jgi:hypothetical protein
VRGHLAWLAAGVVAAGGVAARSSELGAWGLSNDEAWVGLATRVDGFAQFWLAIAVTPVAWAALVKLVSCAATGEAALRAVPFVFGCATMAVAYRAGVRFAGGLGGLLALAAVAFDPLAIAYAKFLKPYTAEAFFCLLGLDRAAVYAERPSRGRLAVLAGVLVVGFGFSHAQLLLAPPLLGALLMHAALRGDGAALRDVAVATAAIGAGAAVHYGVLVAPRLPGPADGYWAAQVYLPLGAAAPRVAWAAVAPTLTGALGTIGAPFALACLAVAIRPRPVVVVAIALLCLEVAALSMLRIVAVSQPRVLLFLTTALVAFGAAAVALVVARARAYHRVAGAAAALALALLAADFVRAHPWRELGRSVLVEDAGPLVTRIERERRPGDTVLVHQTAGFIWSYYQRATPVLDPMPGPSVGYFPRPPDLRVVHVGDADVETWAREALRSSPRVWVLASRLRAPREARLRAALARAGSTAEVGRRPSTAVLFVVTRAAPP